MIRCPIHEKLPCVSDNWYWCPSCNCSGDIKFFGEDNWNTWCNEKAGVVEESLVFRDGVNHPVHYNSHPSGVECIDIVEWFSFNIGNAIKYLWRVGLKSDDWREDLEKAKWYVEREIERLSRE